MFKDDYEVVETRKVSFKCSCSKDNFSKALLTLGKQDLQDIVNEDHHIETVCHYCGEKYDFSEDEINEIIKLIK